mmetsp:Transcript_44111/g.86529  ORF Transcript_44111/g.86529 Transcript_44111/m.86529 type:complete len:243 (-) Transcript_44111:49-777(-)
MHPAVFSEAPKSQAVPSDDPTRTTSPVTWCATNSASGGPSKMPTAGGAANAAPASVSRREPSKAPVTSTSDVGAKEAHATESDAACTSAGEPSGRAVPTPRRTRVSRARSSPPPEHTHSDAGSARSRRTATQYTASACPDSTHADASAGAGGADPAADAASASRSMSSSAAAAASPSSSTASVSSRGSTKTASSSSSSSGKSASIASGEGAGGAAWGCSSDMVGRRRCAAGSCHSRCRIWCR